MKSFEYCPEIRWSDQDLNGHVNNARIFTLIEEARIRWMRAQTSPDQLPGSLVAAHQSIDYLSPVHYGSELRLAMNVVKIGTTSLTVRTRGEQDGRPVLDSTVVLVFLATGTNRPTPITAELRAGLEDYLTPAE